MPSDPRERSAFVVLPTLFTYRELKTMMMMLSALTRQAPAFRHCGRTLSSYAPTMVEKRDGEMGTGGRSSEAGLKVALFGASGFLGHYVCGELGTLRYIYSCILCVVI
jgi:hypothetical protein